MLLESLPMQFMNIIALYILAGVFTLVALLVGFAIYLIQGGAKNDV